MFKNNKYDISRYLKSGIQILGFQILYIKIYIKTKILHYLNNIFKIRICSTVQYILLQLLQYTYTTTTTLLLQLQYYSCIIIIPL